MTSLDAAAVIARVEGRGVPVRGDDIDTDQIIPARFLKWITFKGLEAHVFEDTRLAMARQEPPHPFDDPRFGGGRILITNRNFGCGSSREHAAQAIKRFGIAAIVGESFGEIFAGNCVSIGMPCVTADANTIRTLQDQCEAEPMSNLVLDLISMTVECGGHGFPVHLAEGRRHQFLEGTWDATAVLLGAGPAIDEKLRQLPAFSNAIASTNPLKG